MCVLALRSNDSPTRGDEPLRRGQEQRLENSDQGPTPTLSLWSGQVPRGELASLSGVTKPPAPGGNGTAIEGAHVRRSHSRDDSHSEPAISRPVPPPTSEVPGLSPGLGFVRNQGTLVMMDFSFSSTQDAKVSVSDSI